MKFITVFMVILIMTGCTTVKYNGSKTIVKTVDYPEVDEVVTAYVGDHLVQKGTIVEENMLVVHKTIDGALYDIPAKSYPQVGFDQNNDFYSAVGVVRGGLSDPIQALALDKNDGAEICVITVFGGSACYTGEYDRKTKLSERGNSFQQTLIYSGRVGNKINVGYREFSNNTARPAFNNNVEYDLSTSKTIGYKGAVIEVIKADNSSITYKLIRNFRNTANQ
ncbi:hypothetical protein [Alkalimarinus sediminis]|uniref:Lipoprotein n=1 Tax=Alkalimarinus sediminis TaxID=1632866 RepID=A0A9E8HKK3_9ALTE|nr:hypothetical protein [Alkalimarinus sediminis]UZW76363.1 hypothetical protein NNL22_07190 [Alkalimarinus sediminis]